MLLFVRQCIAASFILLLTTHAFSAPSLKWLWPDAQHQYGKHHWAVSYWESNVANNELDKDALKEISPAFHAHNFTAPVLLMHGERDKIVSYKQSKVMRSALKKAGKEVELIKLEDENHYLMDGQNRLRVVTEMINFIDQHIGDKVQQAQPL